MNPVRMTPVLLIHNGQYCIYYPNIAAYQTFTTAQEAVDFFYDNNPGAILNINITHERSTE